MCYITLKHAACYFMYTGPYLDAEMHTRLVTKPLLNYCVFIFI